MSLNFKTIEKTAQSWSGMMSILLIISQTMACSPEVKKLHDLAQISDGIIGGEVVTDKQFSAESTVAIYNLANGGLCTGSLITPQVVLTAAHCLKGKTEEIVILFNKNLETEKPQYVFASDISIHQNWMSQQLWDKNTGDIALVFFKGTLPQGYKTVALLSDEHVLKNKMKVTLAGYGMSNGKDKSGSGILRFTQVALEDVRFSDTELALDQRWGRGACHGDSGGPAFIRKNNKTFLIGITSRGHRDSLDHCDQFSLYTKVSSYKNWIQEEILKRTQE